jgi:reverse gyrase
MYVAMAPKKSWVSLPTKHVIKQKVDKINKRFVPHQSIRVAVVTSSIAI